VNRNGRKEPGARGGSVRFWHKADIPTVLRDVRFRGEKRTSSRRAEVAAVKPRRRELGIADGVLDRPVAKRANMWRNW
jgi:hypothetical protein